MPQCQQVEVKLPALSVKSAHAGEEKSNNWNSNLFLVTLNFKNSLLLEENLSNSTFVVDRLRILGYSRFAQVLWRDICR